MQMKIRKIFNNNVILLTDDNGHEMIVMGKGIGYNKHNSDVIDFSQVEKSSSLKSNVRQTDGADWRDSNRTFGVVE